MKKIVSLFLFVFPIAIGGVLFTADCPAQAKITKATVQKIFGGMGGISMNYMIEFSVKSSSNKNKASVKTEADSVKSIADSAKLDFNFRKNEKGSYEITFRQALTKPEKCKTCRDVNPKSSNLTKGIIVYYRRGEKNSLLKVKKFKQLADVFMP